MYKTSSINLLQRIERHALRKHSDENTEQILKAAATLFRRDGISATTIRAIAKKANMHLGSVTYRFPTKDDLLVALMKRAVEEVSAEVDTVLTRTTDPVERLRLAMRAHLRVLLSGDDAVHVLLLDWHRLPDATRTAFARERANYEKIWDSLIEGAASQGKIVPHLDLELLRHFAFGVGNSVAFWYRPDGPRSTDEIADAFCALIGFGAIAVTARPDDPGFIYERLGALSPERSRRPTTSKEEPSS